MTGNELLAVDRAPAHAAFRIRRGGAQRSKAAAPPAASDPAAPATAPAPVEWDAGDMGCGELVLELKLRLDGLPKGTIFSLVCDDPGAEEDIPAFCRMTGHALLARESTSAGRPLFRIRRRDAPRA
jgi:tRNA 2-thiouridine synthesizing protein A